MPAGGSRVVRGQREGRGWAWGVLEKSARGLGCGVCVCVRVCVYLSWKAEEEEQQEEEVCGWVGGEFNNGNGEARS